MSTEVGRRAEETVAFIQSGDASLFGILTAPVTDPLGTAVVFIPGSGFMPWAVRRFPVDLGRRAATLGYHGMRFDYRGVGESTGSAGGNRFLMRPAVEDVEAVVAWLLDRGVRRCILVGFCFGAVAALAAAESLQHLEGVALISTPLHHDRESRIAADWSAWRFLRRGLRIQAIRRLLDRDRRRLYGRLLHAKARRGTSSDGEYSWARREIIAPLRALAERGTPALVAYGEEDGDLEHFSRAEPEMATGAPGIDVRVLPGRIHTFDSLSGQEALLDAVIDWLVTRRVG